MVFILSFITPVSYSKNISNLEAYRLPVHKEAPAESIKTLN